VPIPNSSPRSQFFRPDAKDLRRNAKRKVVRESEKARKDKEKVENEKEKSLFANSTFFELFLLFSVFRSGF